MGGNALCAEVELSLLEIAHAVDSLVKEVHKVLILFGCSAGSGSHDCQKFYENYRRDSRNF